MEEVPAYTLRRLENELMLKVVLPGVQSAAEIIVVVRDRSLSVRVPGLYRLELPLEVHVTEQPHAVKFIRKKALLKATLAVDQADDAAQPSGSAVSADSEDQQQAPSVQTSLSEQASRKKSLPRAAEPHANAQAGLPGTPAMQNGPADTAEWQHAWLPPPSSSTHSTVTANDSAAAMPADTAAGSTQHTAGAAAAVPDDTFAAEGTVRSLEALSKQRQSGMRKGFFGKPAASQSPKPAASGPDTNGSSHGTAAGGCAAVLQAARHHSDPPPAEGSVAAAGAVGAAESELLTAQQQPCQSAATEDSPPDSDDRATTSLPVNSVVPPASKSAASQPGPETPSAVPAAGESDKYDYAKERQNKEAAAQCAQAAANALQSGAIADAERAVRLLDKAVRLAPGLYEVDHRDAKATCERRQSAPRSTPLQTPPSSQESGKPGSGSGPASDQQSVRSSNDMPRSQNGDGGDTSGRRPFSAGPSWPSQYAGGSPEFGQRAGTGTPFSSSPSQEPPSPAASSHSSASQTPGSTPYAHQRRGEAWAESGKEDEGAQRQQRSARSTFYAACNANADLASLPLWAKGVRYAYIMVGVLYLVVQWALQQLLQIQQATILLCSRIFLDARHMRQLQGMFEARGVREWSVRLLGMAVAACVIRVMPWLVTGPLWLVAGLWRTFLWRPRFMTMASESALLLILAMKVDYVFTLFLAYPAMLWGTGGGWWGLLGCGVPFLMLGMIGFDSQTPFHGTLLAWTLLSWTILMRWWLAVPASLILLVVTGVTLLHSARQSGGSSKSSAAAGALGDLPRPEVPEGAVGEVARVLGASTHYEVLEVAQDADDETIRKAKRDKLLATHPDKLGADAVGANLAVSRITEAIAVLSNKSQRQQYDKQLLALAAMAEAAATYADQAADLPPGCYVIEGASGEPCILRTIDRPPERARRCDMCNAYHPAKEMDAWIDREPGLFTSNRFLTMQYGKVLDISEWAESNGIMLKSRHLANRHQVTAKLELDLPGFTKDMRRRRPPPRAASREPATPPGPRKGKKGRRNKKAARSNW